MMKKFDKIILVDEDNVANFVNQYIISQLGLSTDLIVFHTVSDCKHNVYSTIQLIKERKLQSLLLIINAHIHQIDELLPTYFLSNLKSIKEEKLLFILLEKDVNDHHEPLFQLKGSLKKPLTEEAIKTLWRQISE